MSGFFAETGAELGNAPDRSAADDRSRVRFEYRILRARQILLGQLANLLEQRRPALIVEMVGFEPAWLVPESGQDREEGNGVERRVAARPDLMFDSAPLRARCLGKNRFGAG
jgi:hypothetical protein